MAEFATGFRQLEERESLEGLIDELDMEWLIIDASHVKVYPQAAEAVGAMGRTKEGLMPKYM